MASINGRSWQPRLHLFQVSWQSNWPTHPCPPGGLRVWLGSVAFGLLVFIYMVKFHTWWAHMLRGANPRHECQFSQNSLSINRGIGWYINVTWGSEIENNYLFELVHISYSVALRNWFISESSPLELIFQWLFYDITVPFCQNNTLNALEKIGNFVDENTFHMEPLYLAPLSYLCLPPHTTFHCAQ